LILSSVGYEDKEVDLSKRSLFQADSENIVINLSMKPMSLDYVTVGVVVVHAKAKKVDTIKTTVNKIFKREQFKIFPNPVRSGSSIKLEIQKAGDYSIQLLDNNAKLILVKKIETENNKTFTEIMLPYDVTPGMYYVVLIDEKKKKQYTDKLIVQ
jgi:nitrate reductase NapAB chaperone NapD